MCNRSQYLHVWWRRLMAGSTSLATGGPSLIETWLGRAACRTCICSVCKVDRIATYLEATVSHSAGRARLLPVRTHNRSPAAGSTASRLKHVCSSTALFASSQQPAQCGVLMGVPPGVWHRLALKCKSAANAKLQAGDAVGASAEYLSGLVCLSGCRLTDRDAALWLIRFDSAEAKLLGATLLSNLAFAAMQAGNSVLSAVVQRLSGLARCSGSKLRHALKVAWPRRPPTALSGSCCSSRPSGWTEWRRVGQPAG